MARRKARLQTLSSQESRYVSQRLRLLGLRSLRDYYATEHWISLRRALRGRRCEHCGEGGRMELHHLTYARLGAELPGDLVTLCDACHRSAHGLPPRRRRRRKGRRAG